MTTNCVDCEKSRNCSVNYASKHPRCGTCSQLKRARDSVLPYNKSVAFIMPEAAVLFAAASAFRPEEITPSSSRKIRVHCRSCRLVRERKAQIAVNAPLCSSCSKLSVKPGESLADRYPEAAKLFALNSPVSPYDVKPSSNQSALIHCTDCKVVRSIRAARAITNPRCLSCSKAFTDTKDSVASLLPEVANLFTSSSPHSPDEVSLGSHKTIHIRSRPSLPATRTDS